jgi:uncharacterized protein (DUF1697 family)
VGVYIGLLRGVNVGGNILRMERLRKVWSEFGFENVRTYVQSGNVVFGAKAPSSERSAAVEQRLAGETRLPVSLILRTPAQFRRLLPPILS